MDNYRILEEDVKTQEDVKRLRDRAEAEQYHLYAGVTSNGWFKYDAEKGKHEQISEANGYMYNDKLYAQTSHFVERFAGDADVTHEDEEIPQAEEDIFKNDNVAMLSKNEHLIKMHELTMRNDILSHENELYRKYLPLIELVEEMIRTATERPAAIIKSYEDVLRSIGAMIPKTE